MNEIQIRDQWSPQRLGGILRDSPNSFLTGHVVDGSCCTMRISFPAGTDRVALLKAFDHNVGFEVSEFGVVTILLVTERQYEHYLIDIYADLSNSPVLKLDKVRGMISEVKSLAQIAKTIG